MRSATAVPATDAPPASTSTPSVVPAMSSLSASAASSAFSSSGTRLMRMSAASPCGFTSDSPPPPDQGERTEATPGRASTCRVSRWPTAAAEPSVTLPPGARTSRNASVAGSAKSSASTRSTVVEALESSVKPSVWSWPNTPKPTTPTPTTSRIERPRTHPLKRYIQRPNDSIANPDPKLVTASTYTGCLHRAHPRATRFTYS